MVLRNIQRPKLISSDIGPLAMRKRLRCPGSPRCMTTTLSAVPSTPPITSAHTDCQISASTTVIAIPPACVSSSSAVSRPTSRWRSAVSTRVGISPPRISDSAATGNASAKIGSP